VLRVERLKDPLLEALFSILNQSLQFLWRKSLEFCRSSRLPEHGLEEFIKSLEDKVGGLEPHLDINEAHVYHLPSHTLCVMCDIIVSLCGFGLCPKSVSFQDFLNQWINYDILPESPN
jgi:hypothetical protein